MSCRKSNSVLAGGLFAAALLSVFQVATATEATREILDQMGVVVKLPAAVRSVGTSGVAMASMVVLLSRKEKLAASAPEVVNNLWFRRIWPGVAKLPIPFSRQGGVNLEVLLSKPPDLVTVWIGNHQMDTRIKALGIPVLHMGYATSEEFHDAVRLLAKAMGPREQERGERLLQYYDQNLGRVHTLLDGLPEGDRPRVYYASTTPFHTEGRNSMVDSWIRAAGGRNVAAEGGFNGYGTVTMESIVAWNPDLIIALGETQREEILADPRWRSIKAVREGRVIVNPRGLNSWATRAMEGALQVLWAAKIFHPKRFAMLDMAAETHDFYKRFYDFDANPEDIRRILNGLDPQVER
jgi:iron complex transport system substrate-binding protein